MLNDKLEHKKEEEEKINYPEKICSLIRKLQSIEFAYNSSHIDRESYIKETNIILEQYEIAKNAYPEYEGLDNFVKNYKLEDCSLAINRLKEEITIQKMTQYFDDLNVLLDSEPETLCVADIIQIYRELCNSIEGLKNLINLQHEDIKKIRQCYLNLRNNREAGEILQDEEIKQMKKDLEIANSTITKQLSSS